MNKLTLTTKDNHHLTIYQFQPATQVKAEIIIAAAMGTAQSYYAPLAKWLSEQGYKVTTFDYRGMGESQHHALKHYDNDILDWARIDCSLVLDYVMNHSQDRAVYWIGHSLGGQVFPLVERIDEVNKVITIASGTGYWKHNAPQLRKKVWWFWFILVPVLLRVYGYFPGKKMGMVGNLPKPVMAQWRRWCMHPEYCVGVENQEIAEKFDRLALPVRSFALTDDEMLSVLNIEALFALFGSEDKQLTQINPKDLGIKRVGHLGFFRSDFSNNLWKDVLLPELVKPEHHD